MFLQRLGVLGYVEGVEVYAPVLIRYCKRAPEVLIAHIRHLQLIITIGKARYLKRPIDIRHSTLDEFLALGHPDVDKLQRLVGLPVQYFSANCALSHCAEGAYH